ncbi:MAG: hypothetical protein LBH55_02815 [Mycoplasmataceae bacterium]|nr:hypothetical protein [Mycoplasmataceae bacterium]
MWLSSIVDGIGSKSFVISCPALISNWSNLTVTTAEQPDSTSPILSLIYDSLPKFNTFVGVIVVVVGTAMLLWASAKISNFAKEG